MRPAGKPPHNTSSSPAMPVETFGISFLLIRRTAASLCFALRLVLPPQALLYSAIHPLTVTTQNTTCMTFYHNHNQAKSNGCFGSAIGSGPPDYLRGIRYGGQGAPADISHLAFTLNPGYCFYEAAPALGV